MRYAMSVDERIAIELILVIGLGSVVIGIFYIVDSLKSIKEIMSQAGYLEEIRSLKSSLFSIEKALTTYSTGSFAQNLIEEIRNIESRLSSIEIAIDNIKDS